MSASPAMASTSRSSSSGADEEAFLRERVYELSTHVDRLTRHRDRITQLLIDLAFGADKDAAARARKLLRDTGWARFCHYCGDLARTDDHIVPTGLGGVDVQLNKVPACIECNKNKGSKFPEEHCPRCVRAIQWHAENSLGFRKVLRERKKI